MRRTERGYPAATLVWAVVAGVLGVAALVPTGFMAVAAYLRPPWAVTAGLVHPWWQPTPDNHLFAVGTLLLWGGAMIAFALAREVRTFDTGQWMVLQAGLTLALGAASYSPCLGSANVVSLPMWLLNLFAGQMDPAVIGPESQVCGGDFPLAFQVARFLGIGTIALAGVALLVRASRTQLDRLWAHRARDIDIVVGVNDLSLDLVEALVAERRAERSTIPFYRETAGEWLARQVKGSRRVLVIRANREDPLLAKVEALGARVYEGDPTQEQVLRRVLLRGRGRISAHRLFVMTTSQARNADILQAALTATADHRHRDPTSWLNQPYVPRLVARFDDPREARDFRLANLDQVGCFVDAVSSDELLAREIVAGLRAAGADTVAIVGDTPLAVSLLDEFALRRAFTAAMETHRHMPLSPPRPERVVVYARGAEQVIDEWATGRVATDVAHPMDVTAGAEDWEDPVLAQGRERPTLAVIITEASAQAASQAVRVSRSLPAATVVSRSVRASGAEFGTPGPRAVVRFGTTLLQSGGVPEDSWTVLAREAHGRYADAQSPRPGSRPWGEPGDPAGTRLPDFYREDTLRQQRWVLQAIAQRGYVWRPIRAGERMPALPDDVVLDVARAEHKRWLAWRRANLWTWGDPSGDRAEMDRKRQNPNMVPWPGEPPPGSAEEKLCARNVDDIRWFVERFREWGIAPVCRFRRKGLVRARVLTEARSWTTKAGSPMHNPAGDWWVETVTGPDGPVVPGTGRGVAAREFPLMYRMLEGEPSLFERRGTVSAVQVDAPTPVVTLEGVAMAEPGMWVVTDERANSWPVPDEKFRTGYEADVRG